MGNAATEPSSKQPAAGDTNEILGETLTIIVKICSGGAQRRAILSSASLPGKVNFI